MFGRVWSSIICLGGQDCKFCNPVTHRDLHWHPAFLSFYDVLLWTFRIKWLVDWNGYLNEVFGWWRTLNSSPEKLVLLVDDFSPEDFDVVDGSVVWRVGLNLTHSLHHRHPLTNATENGMLPVKPLQKTRKSLLYSTMSGACMQLFVKRIVRPQSKCDTNNAIPWNDLYLRKW